MKAKLYIVATVLVAFLFTACGTTDAEPKGNSAKAENNAS
jgi:hypothetical protein